MRTPLHIGNCLALCLLLLLPATSLAQDDGHYAALLGTWEGPLVLGRDNMNLAFTFANAADQHTAAFTSSAMGIFGMPAETVTLDGQHVKIRISRLDIEFNGTLRFEADGQTIQRIDGDYFQQSEMVPVVLLPVASPTF